MRPSIAAIATVLVMSCFTTTTHGAELKPATNAAFDRYVRATEARLAIEETAADGFIFSKGMARAHAGGLVIEKLITREGGKDIDVPDALIHHWLGVVFVPRATVDQAVALLQDYDHHGDIYKPAVVRGKIMARANDNMFHVSLRFFMKKVISVVMNTEHDAQFFRTARDRAYSHIHSTRIAEVDNPDTPQEREKPVGNDSGYLWRLNSYWRFLERDGGTYVQCESISLTRAIPTGFGWLVGPFVTSIPRESLTFTLETTRDALAKQK